MRSKVRLAVGETEWHEVKRGVAQGAVESPWLYSCYIDGMTTELKKRGLGVEIGGRRIPLLMYADDIVMLASSVSELREMNAVATEYARKFRFRHNGEKSAVMAFNADKNLSERVDQEVWKLSGERVKVKDSYKYLGVDVLQKVADWRTHVERLIKKASFRSHDLLWICRRDAGIRPRSAATLWKAMVRPVLEYGSELWAGEIPSALANKAEEIQTDFARAVLGLQGQWGVPNVLVRAELGLEKLESRWEKLRLGYWRRIQVAEPSRALAVVARARTWQLRWGTADIGKLGWMTGTRQLLHDRGMSEYWSDPAVCASTTKDTWKVMVYGKVEAHFEKEREREVALLSSLSRYNKLKAWERMDDERAQFRGEKDKLGALVVERYLDDAQDRLGVRLKLLCRAGCLPGMARVAWELGVDQEQGQCMMCGKGVEDIEHILLSCQAYSKHRERLFANVMQSYSRGNNGINILESGADGLIEVLLGARAGCKLTEDEVDRATKRFLRKTWKTRKAVTAAINQEFGRVDVQWMARDPGWFRPIAQGPKIGKDRGTISHPPSGGVEAVKAIGQSPKSGKDRGTIKHGVEGQESPNIGKDRGTINLACREGVAVPSNNANSECKVKWKRGKSPVRGARRKLVLW